MKQRVLCSWSSGKDSAWGLHALRASGAVEVVGLLTTVNEHSGYVPMHETPEDLLDAQAEAIGLPLFKVRVPDPFEPMRYASDMRQFLAHAKQQGVTAVAFGDLYLADLRRAREEKLAEIGLEALFPLWGRATDVLARQMVAGGLRAQVACVDTQVLPASLAGAAFDEAMLDQLPPGVDPCGEHGEFHTFVWDGPMFGRPVKFQVGPRLVAENIARATLRSSPEPEAVPAWVPPELRQSMDLDELASEIDVLSERDRLEAALGVHVAAYAASARGEPHGLCATFHWAELNPAQLAQLRDAESRFPEALFVAYARPLLRHQSTGQRTKAR